MEPLLPHFCQFYEVDEQLTPPLKLEACARLQVHVLALWVRRWWVGAGVAHAADGCAACKPEASGRAAGAQAVGGCAGYASYRDGAAAQAG